MSIHAISRFGRTWGVAVVSAGILLIGTAQQALAIPSMSRMYKMGCTACHSTMPRLNYFGEKLMLRGNELDRMTAADLPKDHLDILAKAESEYKPMAGAAVSRVAAAKCTSCHNDGQAYDEAGGTQVSKNLFLHKVSNLFSLRYKFTALQVEPNKLTEGGEKKTKITAAKPDWLQLWIGGPIAKNITVRMEAELSEGKAVGLHNYAVAFSNLFGSPEGLMNLRVGGFTHGEWLSITDQKRAFSPHFSIYEYQSAKGAGEDPYKIAGAEPGVEVYGYKGPLVYQVGVSNGKTFNDVNADMNYWTTAKLYLANSGPLAGSSISGSFVTGTDSKNSALATIVKDDFTRYIVSSGLRSGPIDLAGSYVWGTDDNWNLVATPIVKNDFKAGFAQLLYTATDKLTPGVIYQNTSSDDVNFDRHRLLMGFNYYMRQNVFISTYYERDLRETDAVTYPLKQHAFVIQLRGGF